MSLNANEQSHSPMSRMLIVDADLSTTETISSLFSLDFQIDTAYDGATALAIGKQYTPDVVLVDYDLPDMPGVEFCHALSMQLKQTHTPVLFTSATWNDDIKYHCRQVGGAEVIRKPIATEALRWRVLSHFKTKQSADLMAKKSLNDELTHTLNARYINQHLQSHLLSLQTSNIPITLAIVDINDFKLFDDAYAYLEGDECLIKVADVLNQVLNRPADLICRLGADIFVLVLPGIVDDGFIHIAEQIHQVLAESSISYPTASDGAKLSKKVTVSIGAINFRHALLTVSELLSHADEQLFIAKTQSQNQTSFNTLT